MRGRVLCIVAFLLLLLPLTAGAAPLYREGDEGQEVLALQQRLRALGYAVGTQDGVYRGLTVSAVRAFQEQKGLAANGQVDEKTYYLLMGRKTPARSAAVTVQRPRPAAKAAALPPFPSFREAAPGRSPQETAQQYLGVPYRFGGADPRGFDCSGFVMYVFQRHGRKLPRTADLQFAAGKVVPQERLQPGDVVFFTTYAQGASHEGIYLGQDRFVHASSSRGVMTSALSEPYWKSRYLGARRLE